MTARPLTAPAASGLVEPAWRAAAPPPVVLLCPTAWGVRNVVLSGAAERVRTRWGAVRILSTDGAYNALSEGGLSGPDTVELLCLAEAGRGPLQAAMETLLRASFSRRHAIETYEIFDRWRRRGERGVRRLLAAAVRLLARPGSRDPFFGWQIRYRERVARRRCDWSPLVTQLAALRPALVVSTSCVVRDEVAYLRAARELGLPTLGCILSFDNLTSKGVLPVFDHYAVWNERMREQVLRFYPDRDPASVHVTGTPQFDYHVRPASRWSRETTLARLGLESSDRYVAYAANCPTYTPTEPELVAEFARRSAAEPALREHRIVVRPHPGDRRTDWNALAASERRIVLSRPREAGERFASDDAQARLVSTLLHADACLNMASTMSLDAAAVDTPVVCVAFARRAGTMEDWLAGACYRTDHYRPLAASGGVRVARTMDALVAETAAYARDRGRDRVERAGMVARECGVVDGRAAEHLADLIVQLAARCAGSAAAARSEP